MTWLGTGPAFSQAQQDLERAASFGDSLEVSYGDTLLVLPVANADEHQVNNAIEKAHGRIVSCFGDERLRILLVRTEKGKLDEAEKRLGKSKLFAVVQRNY